MRAASLISAFGVSLSIAACAEDPRRAPLVTRDLRSAPAEEPGLVAMAPVPLGSHADFDAFENAQLGRVRHSTLTALYADLAKGANPREREADARLLMRLARLAFRDQEESQDGHTSGLARAFSYADRLRQEAADRPDTLYLLAELKQLLLLSGSSDRTFVLTSRNRDIAERLRDDFGQLLAIAPAYVGPHGVTAATIRADLEALQQALLAADQQSQGSQAMGGLGAPAAEATTEARGALWRLDGAANERQKLCESLPEVPATSLVGWTLRLECALVRQDLDRLATLVREGAELGRQTEACAWARRLRVLFPDRLEAWQVGAGCK
jgi:hypothetical protein